MINKLDIGLYSQTDGSYDIEFDSDGDLKTDPSLQTIIAMTIFGEQRADFDEIEQGQYRKGWIGDILSDSPGVLSGSKSWITRNQGRMTDENILKIKNDDTKASQYIKEAGIIKDITIDIIQIDNKTTFEKITVKLLNNDTTTYRFQI